MSIVEQLLDLINTLIDKTVSGKLSWTKPQINIFEYECKINETISIRIKTYEAGDMRIKIGDMCFYSNVVPAIKDALLILISEVYTRLHYRGVFEERILKLANITLEIEKI